MKRIIAASSKEQLLRLSGSKFHCLGGIASLFALNISAELKRWLLEKISVAQEFEECALRQDERKALRELAVNNKWPLKGFHIKACSSCLY